LTTTSDLYAIFSGLEAAGHSVTSPFDRGYNCVAWIVNDTTQWWEPPNGNGRFWPQGLPTTPDRDAYLALFESWGFSACANDSLESGKEKIAVWFQGEIFQHVAKQLENGWWSSKLGIYQDISHDSNACLCGKKATEYHEHPEFFVRTRRSRYPLPAGVPDLGSGTSREPKRTGPTER
jgi:hypothetical protein